MFEGFKQERIRANGVELNVVYGGTGDAVLLLPSASLVETQQQIQNFASRRGGIPGITQRQGNNTQASPPPAGR